MKRADPSAWPIVSRRPALPLWTFQSGAVPAFCLFLSATAAQLCAQALTATNVGDLRPGTTGSEPQELTNVEGVLYFSADNGTHGRELWKSDPRTGETKMVIDINVGPESSSPTGLVNFQGRLYFAATSATFGRQLWMYDPETEKTDRVVDSASRTGAIAPESLTPVGPYLFFTADDGVRGRELWFLRGKTTTKLDIVRDITPGPSDPHGGSPPRSLTAVGDTLFFVANDGLTGYELWKVDTIGVRFSDKPVATLVRDIELGVESSLLAELVNFNGTLFFTAFDLAVAPGQRLWKTDGTAAGTALVNPNVIVNPEFATPRHLVVVDKQLFFSGSFTNVDEAELFVTDGTSQGTRRVKDIDPGFRGSGCTQLTQVFGVLFFSARDGIFASPPPDGHGATGRELWRSDGTEAGTRMVKDIRPTPLPPDPRGVIANHSSPNQLTAADGTLFFAAFDSESTIDGSDSNLWMSDGTENGTVRVLGLPNKNNPTNLCYVDTTLYFTATDPGRGRELWKVQMPDADGDGLLDKWETAGIDYDMDGVIDLDLPGIGANPMHKDIFVEADYMADAKHSHHPSFLPNSTPLPLGNGADELVQAQFALAPAANVKNPDGRPGINLYLMVDNREVVTEAPVIRFTTRDPRFPHFQDLKKRHFGFASYGAPGSKNIVKLGAHRLVFRYAIFGHSYAEGPRSTGIAGGSDFLVTLSCHGSGPSPAPIDYEDGIRNVVLPKFPGTTFEKEWADLVAGTLMHELGHTLRLSHGGGRGIPAILAENRVINNKPNYLSVMNYAFQTNTWGRAFGVPGVVDNTETRTERPLDYSAVALAELDENSLLEPLGIVGPAGRRTRYGAPDVLGSFNAFVGPSQGAIDWDGDLSITEGNVTADINFYGTVSPNNPRTPDEILVGHDDWSNLVYNFRDFYLAKGGMMDEIPEPEQTIEQIFGVAPVGGPTANLAITKTSMSPTGLPGSNVVYTIVVTNNGPDPASDVIVTDDLPATTTFISSSATLGGVSGGTGNNRTITFASLANGASATITLTARVNDGVAAGTVIANTATVASATPDPNAANNSSTIQVNVVAGNGNRPPTIANVSVSKSTLWPPNHKLVDVTVNYTATDDTGTPSAALSVTSNEPESGTGDDDVAPDWEIIDAHRIRLRAERADTGNGRIYTITITARDSGGLTATKQITVAVPKNQGKRDG